MESLFQCKNPIRAACRSTGREMEVYESEAVTDCGKLFRCRPAPGDPERPVWIREKRTVLWPKAWLYLPGEQMTLF